MLPPPSESHSLSTKWTLQDCRAISWQWIKDERVTWPHAGKAHWLWSQRGGIKIWWKPWWKAAPKSGGSNQQDTAFRHKNLAFSTKGGPLDYEWSLLVMFIWLVVLSHSKNISQLGWLFPIYGKKNMFQTTNQLNMVEWIWMVHKINQYQWELPVRNFWVVQQEKALKKATLQGLWPVLGQRLAR